MGIVNMLLQPRKFNFVQLYYILSNAALFGENVSINKILIRN